MLGTGNALVTRCYNTCFTLHGEGGALLLVDAGGGNGMALQFRYHMRVWSHRKVLDILTDTCHRILPPAEAEGVGSLVTMNCLDDGDCFDVGDIHLKCFDIHSTKELQFGFSALMPDGQRLCCLGDEPYSQMCRQYAERADWLMSEAFCLYEDRDRFLPYEKHHSTVLDAARLAESLSVRNLILYHTEDRTLDSRRQRYTAEAKTVFSGRVVVPDDLERIIL